MGKWTQKADFGGIERDSAVGFSIGTKGYIGTGGNYDFGSLKDFWEYDPSTNTWTQKADFGGAGRWDAVGFSIGTKGHIGTGWNGSNFFNDFWEYDPGNGGTNDNKLIVKIVYPETDDVVQIPFTVRGSCWNTTQGVDYYALVLIEDTDGDGVISSSEFANRKTVHKQEDFNRPNEANLPLTPLYKMNSNLLSQNKKYFLFIYSVDLNGNVSADTNLVGLTKNGDSTRTKDMLKYFTAKGLRP